MGIPIRENESCYASKSQQDVLGSLSELDVLARNFFMTGGTTLSVFYLHHRTSEDLDFFSTQFRDLGTIDSSLKRIFKKDLSLIQSSSDFFSYLIRGTKVDIVFDPLSSLESRPPVGLQTGRQILIDTLDNIASNKLSAVVSRSEAKDLIDLYFIGHFVWKHSKKKGFFAPHI
jgi:predicted nucleotidyltransferase component of viral defense system